MNTTYVNLFDSAELNERIHFNESLLSCTCASTAFLVTKNRPEHSREGKKIARFPPGGTLFKPFIFLDFQRVFWKTKNAE